MTIDLLKKIAKKRKSRPTPHGWMQRDLKKKPKFPKFDPMELENKLKYMDDWNLTWTERSKERELNLTEEDAMEKKAIVAKVMEKLSNRKMDQPPKKWFDMTVKRIMKDSPEYSKEVAKKIVGDIWYNKLDSAKRTELKKEHGKNNEP